ncbi:hypothetical protein [Bacillus dakarensis]|nr:hypothetical protein [Bacillus dakarensis]
MEVVIIKEMKTATPVEALKKGHHQGDEDQSIGRSAGKRSSPSG